MSGNVLVKVEKEAADLLHSTRAALDAGTPSVVDGLFGDYSRFFEEEVISSWRKQARYDDLVDYLTSEHQDAGGDDLWKQILLDLRILENWPLAMRLLDGLLAGRVEMAEIKLKNVRRFPGNHLSFANLMIVLGELMKILYEYAYIIENCRNSSLTNDKGAWVSSEILKWRGVIKALSD